MSETETENPKKPISVYDLLAIMADQAAAIAWQKLGLHPDMVTGELKMDLPEAKVAIDLAAYLASSLESRLDEPDRKEIQNLISTLRINYVEKSRDSG